MLVRLEDILLLDLVKGLAALFLCLGVWWYFNLKRMPFSKRVAWISLFFIQLSLGLGAYWYQTKKYADSEGGDAAALFLNASKLLDVKSKSSVDFWWLIGTGKPKTAVGELAVMHMKIWSKSNHYGLGNEKQRMVRAAALMLWASGRSYFFVFWIFAFLSWMGIQGVAMALRVAFGNAGINLIWLALLLSPSTLLWTALPGKESILLFGIGSIFGGISKAKSQKGLALAGVLLGIYLLFEFRVFLLLCALPVLGFFTAVRIWPKKSVGVSVFLGVGIPLIALFLLQIWAWKHQPSVLRSSYQTQAEYERKNGESYARQVQQTGLNILEKLKFKRLDLEVEARQKKPATGVPLIPFEGSLTDLMVQSPCYIFRGMTGYEWFGLNWKYWIWGLERVCFFGAWVLLLWVFIRAKQPEVLLGGMLIWTLSLGFLMGILMPVLGNISRYMAVLHLPLIGLGIGHAATYLRLRKFPKKGEP